MSEKDIIIGKIDIQRIPFKKFPETSYLLLPNNIVPLCSKCQKDIKTGEYAVLCSDLDKIWHEKCFDRTHMKENIIFSHSQEIHYDFLVLINLEKTEEFIKKHLAPSTQLKIPFRFSNIIS